MVKEGCSPNLACAFHFPQPLYNLGASVEKRNTKGENASLVSAPLSKDNWISPTPSVHARRAVRS